jgi:hypothetical protein
VECSVPAGAVLHMRMSVYVHLLCSAGQAGSASAWLALAGQCAVSTLCWSQHPTSVACRAGRFSEEVVRTTQELEAVVTIICANSRQMPRRDPLRPYMDVITNYAGEWAARGVV